ncbi:MAG: hypothetical protein IJX87_00870 [Clostridia bacterium]|nr:hypothetical protein [Clostridia bacterium]
MGYFNDQKREYVITNMYPRRELVNYLWNETTVCKCNQFGGGFSWSSFGAERRAIETGERNVYVKDRDSGTCYSPNRNYARLPFEKFEAHIGLGYHTVISEYDGVRVEYTLLVPPKGNFIAYTVRAYNLSGGEKHIDLYFCNQPQPDISGHEAYGMADYDEELGGIHFPHEGFALDSEYTHLFLASAQKPFAFETSKDRFCGAYGSFADPESLREDSLSCKGTSFEMSYVGAMQYRLTLAPQAEWENVWICGMGKSREECVALAKENASRAAFEKALQEVEAQNAQYSDVFRMETPDAVLNSQANIWLKRQLSLGKTWGRVYGKGFRDVMQDITAFISFNPKLARERILNVLRYQYEDGNPIRMMQPDMFYPYNDGGVWIPSAVLAYLNETADISVLSEQIPYLIGTSAENSGYSKPSVFRPYEGTEKAESVFQHIQRAMDYLYSSRGKRGLVLFIGGDWNDSLNNAGRLKKGESVWLTIATVKALNEFEEILRLYQREDLIADYASKKEELKQSILVHGMEEDHFLYGFNDYDEKIGSDENEYAKIFLNPQTWAVLAGLLDAPSLHKLMDTVEKRLRCDYGYMQCYPSFRKGDDKIGRVSYFQPGLVENGAVYNHGVAFKIVADCLLGRGDIAYASLKAISFDNPKNPDNGMEPYAVSNMYMGPENPYVAGYAPMSWITGTAGWLYRCVTEYICGVKPTPEGLKIEPCLPSAWDRLRVTRKFRGGVYEIEYCRGEKASVLFNGKGVEGTLLPLLKAGETAKVTVYFV